MMTNLQNNLFTLTGQINEIMSVFFGGNPANIDMTNLSAAFNYYLNAGIGFGKVVRVVLGFT